MTAVRTVAPRVAYQGEPGAYGELAIMRQWGGEATPVSATTFPETLSLLGRGGADYAVIPVWNSTIGEILDTTLLLTHHASRVETVAELTVPVVHCLLGLPGTSLGAVRYVGSHPTALAQCRALFGNRRHLQPCVAHDTAGAARELAALGGLGSLASPSSRTGAPTWFEPYRPIEPTALAVIAGAGVARLYGLTVLVDGVQDNPANATRFVVVRAQDGAHW